MNPSRYICRQRLHWQSHCTLRELAQNQDPDLTGMIRVLREEIDWISSSALSNNLKATGLFRLRRPAGNTALSSAARGINAWKQLGNRDTNPTKKDAPYKKAPEAVACRVVLSIPIEHEDAIAAALLDEILRRHPEEYRESGSGSALIPRTVSRSRTILSG